MNKLSEKFGKNFMKRIIFFIFIFSFYSSLYSEKIIWSTPETISDFNNEAKSPQIGMDANGNVVAVFIQSNRLAARTKLFNGDWSSIEFLSSIGASNPKLVVDTSGNATVIWDQSGSIQARTLPLSGSWSEATTLSTGTSPEISCSSSGDVVAIWEDGGHIKAAIKIFGGNWPVSPTTLSSSGADSPQVAIGSDTDKTVVAVWHNVLASVDTIYSSTTPLATESWTAEEAISTSDDSVMPVIAVDSNGNAFASWFTFSEINSHFSNVLVNIAAKAKSGSWTTPSAISQPGIYDPNRLKILISIGEEDTALAVWRTSFDGCLFTIQSSRKRTSDISWSSPNTIAVSEFALDVDLMVSSEYASAVYLSNDSNTSNLRSVASNINNFYQRFWFYSDFIESSLIDNFSPKIAARNANNQLDVAAIWEAYDNTSNVIRTSDGTVSIIQPPSDLSVSQSTIDFHTFSETINTLTWSASSTVDITGYLIFRDDFFLTLVPPNQLSFIDYNRVIGEMVTYEISAVDITNTESERVSITHP